MTALVPGKNLKPVLKAYPMHPDPGPLPSFSFRIDQKISSFALLFILLLVIYWGSFQNGWHLDDSFNITENPGLRITDLSFKSLRGTFFANQGKDAVALFRPLPCFSFALNWYAGRDNTFGYHLVNLAFHIITAWVLYLLIARLLTVSRKNLAGSGTASCNAALLAAVLWAANPIQTQAVTYIVQRMAIMGTLFYLLGMLFYIRMREAKSVKGRCAYALICFLCFLGGIGSKENAILMPAALILVEWIFFQNGSLEFLRRPKFLVYITIISAIVFFTVYFTIGLPFDFIFDGYEVRPFTLMERSLTQPRIVLGYLSQIFLPLPERLSIAHDIALSTSLWHPWTTLPSIVIILAAGIASILLAGKYPLVSFAVLFYFLNHAVESSFLPLELVFEHRNYLPSAFLFVPVAAGFYAVLMKFSRSVPAYAGWVGLMVIILIAFGFFTHSRNKAWASPETLWRDAVLKAPNNSRPYVFLGIELAWGKNPTPADYRHALVLFNHSLTLPPHRNDDPAKILGDIAWVYFFQGDYLQAVETFQHAISDYPEFHKNRFDLINPLVMLGRFDEAKEHAEFLIELAPNNPNSLYMLGAVCLWQEKYKEAMACFQAAMKNDPENPKLLMSLGVALTRAGYLERGRWFLNLVIQKQGNDPMAVFAMMENRILSEDIPGAKRYARTLMERMPLGLVISRMNALPDRRFIPLSGTLIRPVIYETMTGMVQPGDILRK